jgi:hypothetical protein
MEHSEIQRQEVRIVVGRVDVITIHQVTDNELDALASASPTGFLFDLCIALLSIGISFAVTLTTTTIQSARLESFYSVLMIGCFIGTAISFCLWLRFRRSIASIIARIRKRAEGTELGTPEPGEQLPSQGPTSQRPSVRPLPGIRDWRKK